MSNMSDVVGSATLYGGGNLTYTYDRFCNPNQATYFNQGYLQVPPGIYFSSDYTIIAWINWQALTSLETILDFGNGAASDNIILSLTSTGNNPQFKVFEGTACYSMVAGTTFSLYQWYHIAVTMQGTIGYIYINGNLAYSLIMFGPNTVNRTSNFIGRSNNASIPNSNFFIDDLRIYFGAMNSTQVLSDYTSIIKMNLFKSGFIFYRKCKQFLSW